MKVRITDLLDTYEDHTVKFDAAEKLNPDAADSAENVVEIHQTRSRFAWKPIAGLAAALAVIVAAGAIFVLPRLNNRRNEASKDTETVTAAPTTENATDRIETTAPADTTEPVEPASPIRLGYYCPEQAEEDPDALDYAPYLQLSTGEDGSGSWTLGDVYANRFMLNNALDGGKWSYSDGILTCESASGRAAFTVAEDGALTCTELDFTEPHMIEVGAVLRPVSLADVTEDTLLGGYLRLRSSAGTGGEVVLEARENGVARCVLKDEDRTVFGSWKLENGFVVCDAEPDHNSRYTFSVAENGDLIYEASRSPFGGNSRSPIGGDSDPESHLSFRDGDLFAHQISRPDPEGPDDWEHVPEFPVDQAVSVNGGDNYDGVFIPRTGELNCYIYYALPEAEAYVDLLNAYTAEICGCDPDDMERSESDSYRDGYANTYLTAPNGASASISGNSKTGRFSYSRSPSSDEIHQELRGFLSDADAMEPTARAFVERFASITGPLTLVETQMDEKTFLNDGYSYPDITVPTVTFVYKAEGGHGKLEAQPGLELPIQCSNAEASDANAACFSVTLGANGKILSAENCVTLASMVPDVTKHVPTEENIPGILQYLTSSVENDTLILHSVEATAYTVYFGGVELHPLITVTYSFASAPDEVQTLEIALDAPLEP